MGEFLAFVWAAKQKMHVYIRRKTTFTNHPSADQKLTMVSQFVVSAATPTTVRIISTQKPEKVGSKILFIKTTKRSKQKKLFSDCCKDFSVTKKKQINISQQ